MKFTLNSTQSSKLHMLLNADLRLESYISELVLPYVRLQRKLAKSFYLSSYLK